MQKKALITGITGQDGSYIAQLLLNEGYEVYGGVRRTSTLDLWRLEFLNIVNKVKLVDFDLLEYSNIFNVIKDIKPDEIYNLAAQSFVGVSFKQPILTADTDGMGVLRILDSIKTLSKETKFYQASTSEMFGKVQQIPQTENTPFHPRSPYGVAKLFSHWMSVNYREAYNMFCCSGILFNHESPLRGAEFVTRKIAIHVAKISRNEDIILEIGNMDSQRDWGYAKEYVQGMYAMMQKDKADTYVLATGESHTVREFIEIAFQIVGIEIIWEGNKENEIGRNKKNNKIIVKVNPEFYRPSEVDLLIGNPEKAKKELNWEAKTKFFELTKLMMEVELNK